MFLSCLINPANISLFLFFAASLLISEKSAIAFLLLAVLVILKFSPMIIAEEVLFALTAIVGAILLKKLPLHPLLGLFAVSVVFLILFNLAISLL
jgi:hypothetical protein